MTLEIDNILPRPPEIGHDSLEEREMTDNDKPLL